MFIPSINILPPVTSKNLGIKFINVDLPLPVEPMNAVVVPGNALKLIFSNTSSSASGYLKYTSLNSTILFNFLFSLIGLSIFFIDVSKLNQHYIDKKPLSGIYLEAADINGDGQVSALDASRIRRDYVGAITL